MATSATLLAFPTAVTRHTLSSTQNPFLYRHHCNSHRARLAGLPQHLCPLHSDSKDRSPRNPVAPSLPLAIKLNNEPHPKNSILLLHKEKASPMPWCQRISVTQSDNLQATLMAARSRNSTDQSVMGKPHLFKPHLQSVPKGSRHHWVHLFAPQLHGSTLNVLLLIL